jgi:hypothetical protein
VIFLARELDVSQVSVGHSLKDWRQVLLPIVYDDKFPIGVRLTLIAANCPPAKTPPVGSHHETTDRW